MDVYEEELLRKRDAAHARYQHSLETLESVKGLLSKADLRLREEPTNARKWRGVLDKLETSLDESRKRVELSRMELQLLERRLETASAGVAEHETGDGGPSPATAAMADWDRSVERAQSLNLEEASLLQEKMDSGEIQDQRLAASLELANQLASSEVKVDGGPVDRRQVALRNAIEKIKQQQFNFMTLDEINLVVACHSLLTSRLEPTSKDQRMKRILNGAIKILRRRKNEIEAANVSSASSRIPQRNS